MLPVPHRLIAGTILLLFLLHPLAVTPAAAQTCVETNGFSGLVSFLPGSATISRSANCSGGFYCYQAELPGASYELIPAGCDPTASSCGARATVAAEFPGNQQNISLFDSLVKLFWEDTSGTLVGTCGFPGARILSDDGDASIEVGFDCASYAAAPADFQFSLRAETCNFPGLCPKFETVDVDFGDAGFCPPPPRIYGCGESDSCDSACFGPGGPGGGPGGGFGGASAGGGAPGLSGFGGGAYFHYQGGGVGAPGSPVPTDYPLGRYWGHDYALTLIEDPDPSHVWLVTRFATFREFIDTDSDGIYEIVSPSDEHRTLSQVTGGWQLRDLDGTIDSFDANGRWTQRVDRNGNATVGTYTGTQLTGVTFPDGRSETLAYHPTGEVASVTHVGTDGTTTRVWSYTWLGQDLSRIDRPDGTAWQFLYDDPSHPGFITRLTLEGTDGSTRVEGAWAYDTRGNVLQAWRGATAFTDAAAVDRWQFSYDDPALPSVVQITDPLADVSTYTLGRDAVSDKPRIEQVDGDCPSCGLGANSQREFGDPANPLEPTREIDARGVETRFAYDANGRMTSRIEAFGTALERETTWQYDPTFPALVTEIARPSTSGNPLDVRRTIFGRDAAGNPQTVTVEGIEDGAFFSYQTVTTFNGAGQPLVIDPPGFGTTDQTTFTYDPLRGDLIVDSRTEPLVGSWTFVHDPYNRLESVTDPNGVTRETTYDDLDRVSTSIDKGAVPADDLLTQETYTVFGDRFQTVWPAGNAIERQYDTAGRLVIVERKPTTSPTDHGERMVYTLDDYGHRTSERAERWDGVAWVEESRTDRIYSTRCHLDQTLLGAGSAQVSVTEYAYDCEGNLDRMWDANHPSAGQTAPPSTEYAYDALGRLTGMTQPWGGAGGGTVTTSYAYDVQDHLVEVTDGEGTVTTYVYSDRSLKTREVSEISGTTEYTYNERSELTRTVDARGVQVDRTLDANGRTTFIDYPDPALDTTLTYDDPLVPFSKGRLTSIARAAVTVDYEYDRFGRRTRDGDFLQTWDDNGNRTTLTYPDNVRAITTFDFADRPSTLSAEDTGGGWTQPLVDAVAYLPFGPADQLTLANGLTENRTYDERYYPTGIDLTGPSTVFDWNLTLDPVGQPTSIADVLDSANDKTYAYQDYQYYLEQGDGPWGPRAWTYDRAGNRLTQTDAGGLSTYTYLANAAASGNTSLLQSVDLPGINNDRTFLYDAAGNTESATYGGTALDYQWDDQSRLREIERNAGDEAIHTFDGRGFLHRVTSNIAGLAVDMRYDSEGLIHFTDRSGSRFAARTQHIFYLGSRPIAIRDQVLSLPQSFRLLTTDHLGTPVAVTDLGGGLAWDGGFEPFGRDYSGASSAQMFLRFPGQWEDGIWLRSTKGNQPFYNLHRFYQPEIGRYLRPDPDPMFDPQYQLEYGYAAGSPTVFTDPSGLRLAHVDRRLERALNCSLRGGPPEFRKAINYVNSSNTDWSIQEYDNAPNSKIKRTRRSLAEGQRSYVDEGNKIFVVDTADPSCENVIGDLVREITELYAHEKLGKSKDTALGLGGASKYADPVVDAAKAGACNRCDCKDPLAGR